MIRINGVVEMKLLASDFDNTLWFFDHMKEEDLSAVRQFQKRGHLFGLCTGRPLKGVLKPSEDYDIQYDFYILLSGGLILNKDLEVIFEKKIPLSIVEEIYEILDHQCMSIVYQDHMYQFGNEKLMKDDKVVSSFEELHTDEVNAFSFHYQKDEKDKATVVKDMINERYGEYVEAFQNNEHIDIAARGCSKGEGIKIIQNYFQLDDDMIYGIGDSWNDIPMLKTVKHGYTFTYAPSDVKKLAEGIVETLKDCIEKMK